MALIFSRIIFIFSFDSTRTMTSTYKIPSRDIDLKIKAEFLTSDDRSDRREDNGTTANGDGKKEKQRGRNKDRLGIVHK